MSLAAFKLELLREKNQEKISNVKSLGFQTVPFNDRTERQIVQFLAKSENVRY